MTKASEVAQRQSQDDIIICAAPDKYAEPDLAVDCIYPVEQPSSVSKNTTMIYFSNWNMFDVT